MGKFFIYTGSLIVVSAVAFVFTFTFGRKPSLEQELARRTSAGSAKDRSLSIPSLNPVRPEEEPEPAAEAEPVVEQLTGDVTVTRFPLEEAGVVLLVDLDALEPQEGQGYEPTSPYRQGLARFFDRLPAGVQVGVRSLGSGMEGTCGPTEQLKPCGVWTADDLRSALNSGVTGSPRSLSMGLEDAVVDLEGIRGAQAVVILSGGDEECGGAPCQVVASLKEVMPSLKVHVVMLRPPESMWTGPGPAPILWQTRMECLAERGEGELYRAESAEELEAVLARITTGLQPNLNVRLFHTADRELTGYNAEERDAWGVALRPSGASEEFEARSTWLPARFSVPTGQQDLRVWYLGQERTVKNLDVTAREGMEVQVDFRSGELYVEAKDQSGKVLVGDAGEFNCFWGVEIFQGGNLDREHSYSCTFPAYFVLSPGTYTLRSWMGTKDTWLEGVKVVEGQTTERKAVLAAE